MEVMASTVPPVSSSQGNRARMDGRIIQGRFQLGKMIGAGNFAKVYVARDLRNDSHVAIKIMDKEMIYKNKLVAHILREIAIMKRVRHPYVVRLFEVMASKSKIYLVMEYVTGGELFQHVNKGRLREEEARRYFQQLISAVAFCHREGVFHRDLKPENILIDNGGDLKVSDFGLSALNESQRGNDTRNVLQTFVGTPAYIAPEVLKRQGYDGAKVDIWSCGIILFVLMAGYLPFNDKNLGQLYRKIYKGEFRCPRWFSADLIRLVRGILTTDPAKRMTIAEIMENPWFKKDYRSISQDDEFFPEEEDGDNNPEKVGDGDEDESSGYDSDNTSYSWSAKQLPTLNAFDIISFASGFDLSGLFGETGEETRFLTKKSADEIIAKLENIANIVSFRVKKTNTRLTLDGRKEGVSRPLMIATQIYELTPKLSVLLVKKKTGDQAAYEEFLNRDLKPRLGNLMESPLVRTPQRIGKPPSPVVSHIQKSPSPFHTSKPPNSPVPRSPARKLWPKSSPLHRFDPEKRPPTFNLS